MDTYFLRLKTYITKAYKGGQNGPPYMLIIGNIYEIDVVLTYGSSGCLQLLFLYTCSWLY